MRECTLSLGCLNPHMTVAADESRSRFRRTVFRAAGGTHSPALCMDFETEAMSSPNAVEIHFVMKTFSTDHVVLRRRRLRLADSPSNDATLIGFPVHTVWNLCLTSWGGVSNIPIFAAQNYTAQAAAFEPETISWERMRVSWANFGARFLHIHSATVQ